MNESPSKLDEISDDELHGMDEQNIRLNVENLLRRKRVPAVFAELTAIGGRIHQKLEDCTKRPDYSAGAAAVKKQQQHWANLAQTVCIQQEYLLRMVEVKDHEVYSLVTRWLLLKFGAGEKWEGVRL